MSRNVKFDGEKMMLWNQMAKTRNTEPSTKKNTNLGSRCGVTAGNSMLRCLPSQGNLLVPLQAILLTDSCSIHASKFKQRQGSNKDKVVGL
jgi:hypothetical protein